MLIATFALAGCQLFGGPSTPPPTPVAGTTRILIDAPVRGQAVNNPLVISGRMAPRPPNNSVTYRLFGPGDQLLTSGTMALQGPIEQPGVFAQTVPYQLDQAGPGRVEVLAIDPDSGATLGIGSVAVSLAASGATTNPSPVASAPVLPPTPPVVVTAIAPTAVAPTSLPLPQQIVIDSPAPFVEVGSPVVITGYTALIPAGGILSYIIRDTTGATLGSGQVGTTPAGQGGARFNASINFTLPPNGGPITVDFYEGGGATPVATARITLQVAVPQQIILDTPAPGSQVGSPVVVTGRTARFPFQGNLAYRITDVSGRQIGGGTFDVSGAPGGPTSFAPSLTFNIPPQGGRVHVEISDEDAFNTRVAASAGIDLIAAPPPQQIFIDTPPAFTQIGSPVTITGRTVRFPSGGRLSYRVLNAVGAQLAQGQFPASATSLGSGLFSASLGFPLPTEGGQLTFEIFEVNSLNGAVSASASIPLTLASAPPAPTPTIAPISGAQQIFIDTPAQDSFVGSPVTLTGRVSNLPPDGNLNYRVTDLSGRELASGAFVLFSPAPVGPATWNVNIAFAAPAGGGAIIVEIVDRNDPTNVVFASASIRLQVPMPR